MCNFGGMTKIKSYTRQKKGRVLRQHRERESNFLKYWRVVRYYIRKKYDISAAEHDMLLYLYDLPYFKKTEFRYYETSMNWDKKRFISMKRKGLIKMWRESEGNQGALFELTSLGKTICRSTYKKLLGDEGISELPQNNPVMKRETFSDKMYSELIKKMNSTRDSDND